MSLNHEFERRIGVLEDERTVIPVIDMHLHFVDFLQNTDGFEPLLSSMEKANVSKNVVFGLPVKKKWDYFDPLKPTYYLGDNSKCYYFSASDEIVAQEYLKLTTEQQKKFAPTLCAFNPTDRCAIDYVTDMFEKYPFWKGIGEVLLRHDDLTNLTLEETARANHPAMDPIYEFCAGKKIPVCLHQNSTSIGIHDKYEYLHEISESIEKHPDTTFIWAHCGISRRVIHKNYHNMVNGMLNMYPNLYVDLSWVVYDDVICDAGKKSNEIFIPKQYWIDEVILEYPDRIMIGSDLCGHFDLLGKVMARYNGLFEKIPKNVGQMIAFKNAEKLFFNPDSSLVE
ncbi:MAG: amidohydrolase family protein [Chlorobi bacterium]|nr:amidohydrolase family protein [Chlorobiota bacterium]